MRTHKRQKTMSACSIHPPAHSACSGSRTHASACERPPRALPRRSLTRAPMYPAMGFLWDSTAATVRDDVAAQQGSGLLQWGGGLAARHHGRRGPPDRHVTGVTSDVACGRISPFLLGRKRQTVRRPARRFPSVALISPGSDTFKDCSHSVSRCNFSYRRRKERKMSPRVSESHALGFKNNEMKKFLR